MKLVNFCKILLSAIVIVCSHLSTRADEGNWQINAYHKNDSITITLVANDTKQQLAVLMQGLTVGLPDEHMSITFPSAPMVRNMIKHHPNEVKAMMRKDSTNVEIKPDLFPLVRALCDTTATVTDSINNKVTPIRSFTIDLDKENALVSFSATVPYTKSQNGTLMIEVLSRPGNLSSRKEFTGKRLSIEANPQQNGLGQASMGMDDKNRTVRFNRSIIIN